MHTHFNALLNRVKYETSFTSWNIAHVILEKYAKMFLMLQRDHFLSDWDLYFVGTVILIIIKLMEVTVHETHKQSGISMRIQFRYI